MLGNNTWNGGLQLQGPSNNSKGSKWAGNDTMESTAKAQRSGSESKGSKSTGNGTKDSGMPKGGKEGKEGKGGAMARKKRNSDLTDGMGMEELNRDPRSSEDTTIGILIENFFKCHARQSFERFLTKNQGAILI